VSAETAVVQAPRKPRRSPHWVHGIGVLNLPIRHPAQL